MSESLSSVKLCVTGVYDLWEEQCHYCFEFINYWNVSQNNSVYTNSTTMFDLFKLNTNKQSNSILSFLNYGGISAIFSSPDTNVDMINFITQSTFLGHREIHLD